MSQITDALVGLTQYLSAENQKLDQQEKEKRVQLAAEHIAQQFQKLPPDADPKQMQALEFSLVEDAAAMGGLQENLPLISSMYQSAMQTRELEKQHQQDAALGQFATQEFGIDTPGVTGAQKIQLAQLMKKYEKEYQVVDDKGVTWAKRFDNQGEEIFNLKVNSVSFDDKINLMKKEAFFKQGLMKDEAKFKLGLQKDLAKYEYGLKSDYSIGSNATGPQLTGYKFLKGQQGPGGEVLYEKDKGGGLFTINKSGQLVAYTGEIISRKGQGAPVTDVLKSIQESRQTFGPIKFDAAQQLLSTDQGMRLIEGLIGHEPQINQDKSGNDIISSGDLTALENALTTMDQEDINKKLKEVYSDEEIKPTDLPVTALNLFNLAVHNQQAVEKQLYNMLPENNYNKITDVKTWNTGVEGVRNILKNNSNVSDSLKAPILTYIAKHLNLPDSSVVSMQDYNALGFPQQQHLNTVIANNSAYITE